MECQNCYYVVAPGQAAEEGACPKCQSPFGPELDQPSPTTTDFQAFGMPDPGEDDGNQGNPLAVGTIMGKDGERGFTNRDNFMSSRRFDVLAPWWHTAEKIEDEQFIPMEDVEVLEEDEVPEDRKDRKLDTIEKKAIAPAVAVGAGLVARGLAGAGAGAVTRAGAGTVLKGALGKGAGFLKHPAVKWGGRILGVANAAGMIGGALGVGKQETVPDAKQPVRDNAYYSFHQVLAENAVGLDRIPGDTSDPEDVDQKEHNDGENTPLNSPQDTELGNGGALGFSPELEKAFDDALPNIFEKFFSDDAGEEDPALQQLVQQIQAEDPDFLNEPENGDEAHRLLIFVMGGDPDDPKEYEEGHDPMNETPHDESVGDRVALQQPPLQGPAHTVLRPDDLEEQAIAMKGRCMCGATIDPSQPACAQCGTPTGSQLGQGITAAYPPIQNVNFQEETPMPMEYEVTEIPPDMTIQDWKTQGRPVHCDACQQPTVDRDSRTCNNCGTVKQARVSYDVPVPALVPQATPVTAEPDPYPHQCPGCKGMGVITDPIDGTKVQCVPCKGTGVRDGDLDQTPYRQRQKMADTQGPNTDEQKAAVAQLLQEQGRAEEIPQMIVEPWNYAEELAEIIGRDQPPEADTDEQAPAPPVEAAPPGATMPMPGMGGPPPGPMPGMMAAINKYAAPEDHVRQHGDNFDNEFAIPAADEVHQENVEQEQDTGHTWMDENGEPLRVGQEYELFSDEYDIPDLIRVEAVKPDSLEYTLTGEYGLEHRTEVDNEEAQIYNYSFRPAQADHAEELGQETEQVQQDVAAIPTVGQDQTDLSTPHQLVSKQVYYNDNLGEYYCENCVNSGQADPNGSYEHEFGQGGETGGNRCAVCGLDFNDPGDVPETEHPMGPHTGREWLRVGGAKFTPVEQRDFIEEAGVARNADKLDLSGTHYESRVEVDPDYFLFGM